MVMKKGKKLFGAIGVLALLVTAFVAFGSGKAVKADAADAASETVDKQTVTLHKYAFNTSELPDITNDGSDQSKSGQLTNAEPLEGITFKFYDVTTDYYALLKSDDAKKAVQDSPNDYTSVADYATKTIQANKALTYSTAEKLVQTDNNTTNEIGEITNKLPTTSNGENAVYLIVEEADTTGKIASTSANLVVSLPFYDKNNKPLDTVNLYPKNVLNEVNLKFTKFGVVDNTVDKGLDGAVFYLKKSEKNDKDEYEYVSNGSTSAGQVKYTTEIENAKTFTSINGGKVETGDLALANGKYTFEEKADEHNITVASNVDKGNTNEYTAGASKDVVTFSVDSGKSTLVSYYDMEGKEKNSGDAAAYNYQIPVPNKTAKDFDEEKGFNIGDTVTYTITEQIPYNVSTYDAFTITDTPAKGLLVDRSTIVAKIGDAVSATDDSDVVNDPNAFSMAFLPGEKDALEANAGKNVTITYEATITQAAVIQDELNNTVEFTPGKDYPNIKTHKTPINTYGFKFVKKDANTGGALKEAKFLVLKTEESKTYYRTTTNLLEQNDGNVKAESASSTSESNSDSATPTTGSSAVVTSDTTSEAAAVDAPNATTATDDTYGWKEYSAEDKKNNVIPADALVLVSDEEGRFEVKGLASNTYQLKEVVAPKSYQLPTSTVDFTVSKTSYKDEKALLAVQNKQEGVLPHTGGKGIIAFIVAGIAIIVIAVVYFKRRHTELEA
jgi:fimbrial isopeptide formation D2 family protein/LPXTG-motif cell wall-anchored protein